MAVTRTMFVTLDCADARTLAQFWAAMLDGTIVFSTPRSVGVHSEAGRLAAMVVADYRPPTWPEAEVPKQIHLDLSVDDLEAAVAEAVRHGAIPATVQPAPEARRILLDPAGHPFCLTTMIPRESAAGADAD
ncbi:MAG TPA: VOC family protein [Kineosporiaceae bacterium]